MLVLKNRISDLADFKPNFTAKDKEQLTECFAQIQEYIKAHYMAEKPRGVVELQLHYNAYTHSYLVIDLNNKNVYLSHRNHGSSVEKYFCADEPSYEGWKYAMCLIVVERWEEIKEILDNYLGNIKSIFELYTSFKA